MKASVSRLNLPTPEEGCPSEPLEADLQEQFLISNESALADLEAAALRLEADRSDAEALREAKRIIHTIKGETGFLGMGVASRLCHDAETLLESTIAQGECPTDLILSLKDWLQSVLERISKSGATAVAPPAPTPSTGRYRFLVIEDTPVAQILLQRICSEYGAVTMAGNGREGVEAFERALRAGMPFDLVCLDIMMPEMNGHEALARIRALEAAAGILGLDGVKVIMTTALSDARNVLDAFREQCEAYIVKPVTRDKMRAELRKLHMID